MSATALDRPSPRGLDPRSFGKVWYLGQLGGLYRDRIGVRGEDRSWCITGYKAHGTMAGQLARWVEDWETYAGGSYCLDAGSS